MESLLKELLSILENSVALYRRLQTLLQQEQDAVVVKQIDALSATVKQKETLLFRLRNLEVERMKVMGRIAQEMGISPQRLSLSYLTSAFDSPIVDQIEKSGAMLKRAMDRIKHLNRANERLLRHSLEFVRGSMSILKSLMAPPIIYQKNGRVQGDGVSGRMVHGQF